MKHIAPSLLAADFTNLAHDIAQAEAAGADLLHVDIMDGQFVPNISFGGDILKSIRAVSTVPLDVHLMIDNPDRFIPDFAAAAPKYITVHPESTIHVHRTLTLIREHGVKPGLVLNPLTPLTLLEEALPLIDLVVVMSINPGFGGQSLIPESIEKITRVAALRDALNPNCKIEADGGVNVHTAASVAAAGADILVAGSAIFNQSASVQENMQQLRKAIN